MPQPKIEERSKAFREGHLKLLEPVHSVDQVQPKDILFVDTPGLEDIQVFCVRGIIDNSIEVSALGTMDHTRWLYPETNLVYKANLFHQVLALVKATSEYRDAVFRHLNPDIPEPTVSDKILLYLFEKNLDELMVSFNGFSKYEISRDIHSGFRQWDPIDNMTIAHVIWLALYEAPLFWYFYNKIILKPQEMEYNSQKGENDGNS